MNNHYDKWFRFYPDLNMFIAVLTKDTLICKALICGVLYEYELKAESFWKSDTLFGRLL